METLAHDPFSTKGAEYLLVLAFLVLLPIYSRYLGGAPLLAPSRVLARQRRLLSGWFRQPEAAYYHPGHTWAMQTAPGRIRIGVDDFAQKLLGKAQAIALPEIGARLAKGEPGWSLDVDAHRFDLPAPVTGCVVARNEAALDAPDMINDDPYGKGWLLEMAVPVWRPGLRTLLHGNRAKEWLVRAENALRLRMIPEVGAVLQDGGVPVPGIARALATDDWDELARDLLFRE